MQPEKPHRRGTPPGKGTIVPAHGGVIGNPAFVPTDEQRAEVLTLAKVCSIEQIADLLGLCEKTVRVHFKTELTRGRAQAVSFIGAKLLQKAMGGNLGAMIFYLKTRGKWSSRVEVTGPDGGPLQTVDLSKALDQYSEEELALLEPLLEQLLIAAGSADFDFRDQLGSPTDSGAPK